MTVYEQGPMWALCQCMRLLRRASGNLKVDAADICNGSEATVRRSHEWSSAIGLTTHTDPAIGSAT